MTQYLSRRERRMAEKSGIPEELTTPQENQQISVIELEPLSISSAPVEMLEEPKQETSIAFVAIEPLEVEQAPVQQDAPTASPLSRRAIREAEKTGKPILTPVQSEPIPSSPMILETDSEVQSQPIAVAEFELESSSVEEPITFTGTNLLAEPSTQSIVLEVVPEAVSLPIDVTGEIVSTGSIAVIPDTTAAIVTATMDGSQLDQVALKDAVTGVISVVEPVSAISVISERENIGVVPEKTLRKGWWIKWLIGISALVMTAAAVWATLTILELIGN